DVVVETRKLTKIYRDFWGRRKKTALRALNIQIERGEIFGLLGPNGSGKTTTIKLLLGLLFPTEGDALVFGQPAMEVRKNERIGYLPEESYLYRFLNAEETLDFYGRLFDMPGSLRRKRAKELIDMVRLTADRRRIVREYSKGMTQRAGLAQALINDPELVFLDEPTSGLDPLGRLLVRDIIQELRDRGTTVFLNSHLLGEVEATCDRVVFVREGGVVRELSLAETSADLPLELRIAPLDPATLAGLAAFGTGVTWAGERVRMRVNDESEIPKVAAWLVAHGLSIYELRSRGRSLEEW